MKYTKAQIIRFINHLSVQANDIIVKINQLTLYLNSLVEEDEELDISFLDDMLKMDNESKNDNLISDL